MTTVAPPTSPPVPNRVSVRMYRGLLGDCFLLTQELGDSSFRALIDCGVLQCIGREKPQTGKGAGRLARVVEDLARDAGGHLNLVIVTHAHYDHVSGFILQNAAFANITIDQLWLAWTENRDDELARAIREKRSRGLAALAAAFAAAKGMGLEAADPATAERLQTVGDLLQFYGEIERLDDGLAVASAGSAGRPRSCDGAIEWLKAKVGAERVTYFEPGQQVAFGLEGALVANVLGPPRTEHRLTQMDPSPGKGREVYLTGADEIRSLETTLRLADGSAGAEVARTDLPFTGRFRRWPKPGSYDAVARLYYDSGSAERRIDGEWLGSAEALALKVDGDVNNTSLALAIEIPGGDVLLFPGDAQVGNWLSWHDQRYPSTRRQDASTAGKIEDVPGAKTATELLARVVLYKGGHHLSHNATARALGLELMTSPDLVAMGPVVSAVAHEQRTRSNPDGWAMPYGDLLARLKEKTRGRLVLGDGDPDAERRAFAGSRFTIRHSGAEADPLWVELSLDDADRSQKPSQRPR